MKREECALCGVTPADWLYLELSRSGDQQVFWLYPRDTGREGDGSGVRFPVEQCVERWAICRNGHLRAVALPTSPPLGHWLDRFAAWAIPEPPDRIEPIPNVIRLLGSVGGGKSQLVRALRQEVIPPAGIQNTTRVANGHSVTFRRFNARAEAAALPGGTLPATAAFDSTTRVLLASILAAMRNDDQTAADEDLLYVLRLREGELTATSSLDSDLVLAAWGAERVPYLLRTVTTRGHIQRDGEVALVDLPGEVVNELQRAQAGNRAMFAKDAAQLKHAKGYLAVVDAMALPSVWERLPERARQASVRPNMDLGSLLGSTRLLIAAMATHEHLVDNPVYLAVNKADTIRYLLGEGMPTGDTLWRWQWLWEDSAATRSEVVEAAALVLLEYVKNQDSLTGSGWQLLEPLSRHAGNFDSAQALAIEILAQFGEPEMFWRLVADGHAARFSLPRVGNVTLSDANSYWFEVLAGHTQTIRDVTSAVVTAAILTAVCGINSVATLIEKANVRFFLTCTREHVRPNGTVEIDPRAAVTPSGTLQLLARVIQGAIT